MGVAQSVAKRGTCDRARCGCVIVVDKDIVATGYNGSLPGAPHCDGDEGAGHDMLDGHCVRTVHAEANAIARAARSGVSVNGGSAYVTHEPCRACAFLLANAGIQGIYYAEARNGSAQAVTDRERTWAALIAAGVRLIQLC